MASHAGLAMLIGGVNVAYAQVANDGTTNYQTLKDAFDGAATGKTIKVLKDIEDFGAISFTNKTLTLNLDGHTVSGTSITVGAGAAFTIQTKTTPAVTVDAGYNVSYDAAQYGKLSLTEWVEAVDGGQVTMTSGMVESTDNTAFFAFGDKTGKTSVSSKVTINGGYVKAQEVCASPQGNGAEVIIEGGINGVVLESLDNAVVAGNGTYTADKKLGGTTINIKGSKKNPCVLIGRIQTLGYVACGVYHPQQGKLTIGNYTKIVALGGAGVVMRGGELNLGGTTNIEVVATGDANLTGKVGDSRVVVGTSGIVFDRDCGYYDVANTKIKVTGANTSVTGSHAAVQVINENNHDVSNVISITGGTFSSDVSAFVDADHDFYQKDDKYYVTRYVAQVGNEKYTSVLTAVNKAAAGATVQLLKNVSMGNAFSVSKQVTLDLNGKTLTIPYIEVNKDGNLTIKDGIAAQAGQEGGQLVGTSGNYSVYVRKGGVFTLESGTLTNNSTVEGTSNVVVWVEGDASTAVASTANVKGGKIVTNGTPVFARYNGATVNVSGGELEGHGLAAIAGNGSKGMGGTTINISGGTLTAYNAGGENDMACGVYHPQDGVLNITGGTIKAVDGVGVLMRSGQMKMTGGVITATGDANKSGTVGDSRVVVGRSGVVIDRDANYPVAENMSLTIDKDAKVSGTKAAVELLNTNEVADAMDAIHLLGGTYSSDVTDLLGENSEATKDADGNYTVRTYYAQVGNEKYTSLAEAVSAAKGNPVVLLQDVDQAAIGALKINKGQDITLDLNGHSVRCSNSQNGYIYIQGKLTLKDSKENSTGRIYSDSESNYVFGKYDQTLIYVEDGGEFVMESGRIETVMDDAANKGQFAIGVWGTGKVTINGGTINAGWYAIAGSGKDKPANTSITVNGGTLVSTADYAIYHPQTGTLTINGGTVYGEAGAVAMKRGDLFVNDGILTSKGKGNTGTWGDGTGNLKNAALNFTKLYGPVTATIKGGKITSEGDALLIDAQPTEGKKADIAISGGTYSSDVTAYCADGFMSTGNGDGTYGITKAKNAIFVGQDKNVYLAEGGTASVDWLSLKKVVVANEVKNVSVSLTRDYANTGWNSFCVPFDITLTDEMLKTFDFAEIWDTELDQTTGGTTIEFITCKAGDVLPAYFPCIIKAKEAGKQTLTVENTTLKTPTNKTEGCSTMKQTFTFYGVLEQTYTAEKYGFCLRSSDNALLYNNDKDGYICPFFFYMTIQNKADGSYFIGKNTEESRRVAIHVIGDNEATGISQINMGASSSEEAVYNLQGVRMNGAVKDLPKGVYIRNGHKFVVK